MYVCCFVYEKRKDATDRRKTIMPYGNAMKNLEEGTVHKYLGILEDEIKQKQVKDGTTREYFGRVRIILKLKRIFGLNFRALSILKEERKKFSKT